MLFCIPPSDFGTGYYISGTFVWKKDEYFTN